MTYLLGIDLGTTTCRAAVFDLDGHEIAAAYREIAVGYPRPLWAEVDPDEWWQGVTRVVREIVARVPPDQIGAVGLSGLMHAPVLLDGAGQAVAPAMLWMDQRCAPQCDALRREYATSGLAGRFSVATGQSAPKLRWLAEVQPDVLARARYLLLPKDFVRYRLTGDVGTDPSDAGGTGLFDRERGDWCWEIIDLTRTPRGLIPAIRPSAALAGTVTAEAAPVTGLAPGTPVAVGGADTLCTRLGAGGLGPNEICLYLGTAAWIAMSGARGPDGRPTMRGFGATSTTGATLRWLRDLLGVPADGSLADSYDALTRLAREVPPGAEGLYFLPHLMGERGPRPDPLARGALVGLTLRHGRPHVVRAVLEGIAFHLRRLRDLPGVAGDGSLADSYDALTRLAREVPPGAEGLYFLPHLMGERGPRPDPLARGALVGLTLRHGRPHVVRAVLEGIAFHLRRLLEARIAEHWPSGGGPTGGVACGGVARSDLWMGMLADVTRLSLRVPEVVEAGVLGAAMLGGAAAGLLSTETAAARMVRFARHYAPDPAGSACYDAVYARYRGLDDVILSWFHNEVMSDE